MFFFARIQASFVNEGCSNRSIHKVRLHSLNTGTFKFSGHYLDSNGNIQGHTDHSGPRRI